MSKPVALVSMPSLSAEFPSFQLALLKPTLERAGINTQTFSMYMYFGSHIGWPLNEALAAVRPCMAGEWIWSKAAFGDFSDQAEYLHYYEHNYRDICSRSGCSMQDILKVRNEKVFTFLDFCIGAVDWSRFELIGFTVVFQQMVATLALAQRLKERHPEIPIVLGGATFEDDIASSVLQGCDYIDYVHCGDGDRTFPEMVRRLRSGDSLKGMRGVMRRVDGCIDYAGRSENLRDLNATPIPNFDEYFYARRESGYSALPDAREPMLPIETGRGCWWGMKNHCTFCGLNRAGMEFRAKSVDNVLEVLQELSKKYGLLHFDAIDNIMAPEYIENLFGRLAELNSDIKIHYEVRPYLSRDQLRHLSRGGLFSVQPGIESFSTRVLKLMKKHSTGMRNLSFLKWCTYYGINNLYNVLYGFAGEQSEDYRLQCELIPKIPHFQPPWAIAQARADRGSPMFTEPGTHGVGDLRPSACYPFIYPQDRFDLKRVSYFFEHDQHQVLPAEEYQQIRTLVDSWQQSWKREPRPSLRYFKSCDSILIEDQRNGVRPKAQCRGRSAELYEFCNDPRSLKSIRKEFGDDETWIRSRLDEFLEQDWMVCLDDRYLSLALPANSHH